MFNFGWLIENTIALSNFNWLIENTIAVCLTPVG